VLRRNPIREECRRGQTWIHRVLHHHRMIALTRIAARLVEDVVRCPRRRRESAHSSSHR
jgi:hypothetical protein